MNIAEILAKQKSQQQDKIPVAPSIPADIQRKDAERARLVLLGLRLQLNSLPK